MPPSSSSTNRTLLIALFLLCLLLVLTFSTLFLLEDFRDEVHTKEKAKESLVVEPPEIQFPPPKTPSTRDVAQTPDARLQLDLGEDSKGFVGVMVLLPGPPRDRWIELKDLSWEPLLTVTVPACRRLAVLLDSPERGTFYDNRLVLLPGEVRTIQLGQSTPPSRPLTVRTASPSPLRAWLEIPKPGPDFGRLRMSLMKSGTKTAFSFPADIFRLSFSADGSDLSYVITSTLERVPEVDIESDFEIGGTVRDDEGRAIPGAKVLASRTNDGYRLVAETTTTPDGTFVFRGLEDDFYKLRASIDGRDSAPISNVSTQTFKAALTISRPGSLTVVTERPTKNARITLRPDGQKRETHSFTFDGDNRELQVPELSPDFYFVRLADETGWSQESGPYRVQPATDVKTDPILINSGARLTGQIESNGAISWVTLVSANTTKTGRFQIPAGLEQRSETFSNESGEFVLEGVEAGTYRLLVRTSGFVPSLSEPFEVSGQEQTLDPVSLVPGAEVRGTLTGLVPGASATIEVKHLGDGRSRSYATRRAGSFFLGELDEGSYKLEVWVQDPTSSTLSLSPNHEETFYLGPGESKERVIDLDG